MGVCCFAKSVMFIAVYCIVYKQIKSVDTSYVTRHIKEAQEYLRDIKEVHNTTRLFLTRFSQGETWLLDWDWMYMVWWAVGHQTLVLFDNNLHFL